MTGQKTFGTEVLTSSDVNEYLMKQAIVRVDSGSRPSLIANGSHVWETDNLLDYHYNGSTWELQDYPFAKFAYKTTDESLTSSTTAQDDDELFATIPGVTATWLVDVFLLWSAATNVPDIGVDFTWNGSAPLTMAHYRANPGTADDTNSTLDVSVATGGQTEEQAGGNIILLYFRNMVMSTVSTSFTTFHVRWRQSTSSATATVVRAGSFLYAYRIA